ncbi:sigma-70 family RNA polymerase sigma factor [uncultured Clostridium sp.]|jgi:RNA polymerase sigma-70 factor (ECF subfamily)|uniref:RNA polymerase sigma factor n=1 Tax=uncultured Clostridium sp. TaxID=59620 RepID=UPI00261F9D03|nr:sigma-70 family RNA polymerase sigma factor [uncultured Clostridium sp.]
MEIGVLGFNRFKLKKEKTVIGKAIDGDKEAFTQLIRENKLSLYKVAKGILNREEDVEDALSSCILNSYKNIKKLRNEEYFKTWLIRILINECNYIIKKNDKINYIQDYNTVNNGIDKSLYKDTYKDIDLDNALKLLDKPFREVIVLFYYNDLKQSDIAKILELNETTVRTRLFRAKEKLREILEGNEDKGEL